MAIRVLINTSKFKGGPAIFRSRLINAFDKLEDIEITTNFRKKFDLELAFIRRVQKHNKPYVLRADGCYYQKGRPSNSSMVEAIIYSQYAIFQSKFSLKLCDHVLNIKEQMKKHNVCYSVIHNGIDLDYINSIPPAKNIEPGSFVACARWRDNKRPKSMIKGFLKSGIKRNLYIIGGTGIGGGGDVIKKKYNSKYIKILGEKSMEETIGILKACDYLIHLCHIDSCPNIVIEGLCCGLNVLCTNLGGTPELVKSDGVILNVDKFWKGKKLDSTKLDCLDSKIVANGLNQLVKIKIKPERQKEFDINNVVKKYMDIIKTI